MCHVLGLRFLQHSELDHCMPRAAMTRCLFVAYGMRHANFEDCTADKHKCTVYLQVADASAEARIVLGRMFNPHQLQGECQWRSRNTELAEQL